jgi:uncharacterized protein (DUF1499 family)
MPWTTIGVIAGVIVLAGIVTLALVSIFSPGPGKLGVTDGRLAPCPSLPNCVCTQAADPGHAIEPIALEGKADEALARLKAILTKMPRVRIVTECATYLHAEYTSQVFRFVDDVEFLLDEGSGVIHFRSASRAGRSDFGVNRKRMEAIRKAFTGKDQ